MLPVRFLSKAALAASISALGLVATPAPALAAETSNSEIVIIQQDDVLAEDLYAGAIRVLVEGEIDGDLVAFAADEVVVDGSVTGSVLAVAPTVVVNGTVGGSVRVSGGSLTVTGSVAGDVVAAVANVSLDEGSTVGGDVVAWALDMSASGTIGNDLRGSQRTLDLAGEVGNDVDVSVMRMEVTGELSVGGDLEYRSDHAGEGLDRAEVTGALVERTPLPPNIRVRALGLLGRFLTILFLTIAALTVAWSWPRRTADAIEAVTGGPVRAWASGALVLFSPVILVGVATLTLVLAPSAASFPLLAVFAPLTLAALGLVGALALVAGAPVVGWLGGLTKRLTVYGAILAGSVFVGLLWLVPMAGWLVPIVVLPLGLGAWMRGGDDRDERAVSPGGDRAT